MKFLAVAVLIAVVVSGCGDDGGPSEFGDPGESGALATAAAVNESLWQRQDYQTTYRLMSPECRDVVSYGDFAGELAFGIAIALGFMGVEADQQDDITVGDFRVLSIIENEAYVANTMRLGDLVLNDSEAEGDPARYVYVDNRWWATCDDFDAFVDGGGVVADETFTGELRPAEEVVAEQRAEELANGTQITIGDPVQLNPSLSVAISSVSVLTDSGGPMIQVEVRVENSGGDTSAPWLALICGGSDEEGGWQADSTYRFYDDLPAGTFLEGTVNLLIPGDARYGEDPVPTCIEPARILVASSGNEASLALAGSALGEINAAADEFNNS